MTLTERRLTIALNAILKADGEEELAAAMNNAKVVAACQRPIKFIPEIEGSNVDEGSMSKSGNCDVYIDGVWQPSLIATLDDIAWLNEKGGA